MFSVIPDGKLISFFTWPDMKCIQNICLECYVHSFLSQKRLILGLRLNALKYFEISITNVLLKKF